METTTNNLTDIITTQEPTTQAPTTEVPTTEAPTTEEPTTQEPTTEEPTTEEPTTEEPTTEEPTTEEPLEIIDVYISSQQTFYRLDETFDAEDVQIIIEYSDHTTSIVDSQDFSIRSFSTTTPGERTAFIRFGSVLLEYNYIVLEDYAFEIDMEYYQDAINLRGDLLKVTLNNIITENFIDLLYADAIWVLEESDVDPNNPNNVILVYPGIYGESVPTGYSSQISGYYWNREHVWPQSRLGVGVSYDNDFPSKATDVHNLKPADPTENSNRSNDYFDYFKTSDTYEPNDNVKGDIARILFYMATMYFDLTLNDNIYSASQEKTMGILSVLLEWNELDPVDDFERNRNDVIFSYQGNRNPFVDYPGFAELIWGDLAE
ncbi:MAG: endonuclease [Acholeplasmataceae bacterium]